MSLKRRMDNLRLRSGGVSMMLGSFFGDGRTTFCEDMIENERDTSAQLNSGCEVYVQILNALQTFLVQRTRTE